MPTEIEKAQLVDAVRPVALLYDIARRLCTEHDQLRSELLAARTEIAAWEETAKFYDKLEAVVEAVRESGVMVRCECAPSSGCHDAKVRAAIADLDKADAGE